MKLKGEFKIVVQEGVTEVQVADAIKAALHGFKVPGTIEEVYVGSDDQPPHP